MKGDDIAERLLEFTVAVPRITTKGISLLVERHSACEVLDKDLSGLLREAAVLAAILAASAKTARTAFKE